MAKTEIAHTLRRQSMRKLHFAQILTENETETTYDTPFASPWTNAIKTSPSTESTELYSDDVLADRLTSPGDISVEITKDACPLELQAKLLGHKYKDGTLVKSDDDVAPFFAVLSLTEYAPGKYELDCIYRVQFELVEREIKTREKTPAFVQQTLKGAAYARLDNGAWEIMKDKKAGSTGGTLEDLTEKEVTEWFTSVPEVEA